MPRERGLQRSKAVQGDAAVAAGLAALLLHPAGVFVPSLWTTEDTLTYAQLMECPASSAAAESALDGAAAPADASKIQAALLATLKKFVKDTTLTTATIASGLVTVTDGTNTWKYAITEVRKGGECTLRSQCSMTYTHTLTKQLAAEAASQPSCLAAPLRRSP